MLFALGAVSYALSAVRVLTEQWLGIAGGRLFLAALFAFGAIAAGALALTISRSQPASDEKSGRVAALVDAVSIGYDLAQDVKAMFAGGAASPPEPSSAEIKRAKKQRADARRNPEGEGAANAPL